MTFAKQFPSTVEVPAVQPTQLPNLPGNGGITVTNLDAQYSADVSTWQAFPAGQVQTLAPHQSTIFAEGSPVWARVTPGQAGSPASIELGIWPGAPSAPQGAVDVANEVTINGTVDIGTVTGTVTIDANGTDVTVDAVGLGTLLGTITTGSGTVTVPSGTNTLIITSSGSIPSQPKVSFIQDTATVYVPCSSVTNSDGATETWVAQCPLAATYTISNLPAGTVFVFGNSGIERVEATVTGPLIRGGNGALALPMSSGLLLNEYTEIANPFQYIPLPGATYTLFSTTVAITSITTGGNAVQYHLIAASATTYLYGLRLAPGQSYTVNLASSVHIAVSELAGTIELDPAPLQVISVPNPAAGADWSYTLPFPARLAAVSAAFTTSATVTTRWPALVGLLGPAPTYAQYLNMTTAGIAASSNAHFQGWPGAPALPVVNTGPLGSGMFTIPDIVLPAGATVQSVTLNLQAGDQWSGIVLQLDPS